MLRSLNSLRGSSILAKDGEMGHVRAVLFHDRSWLVRYLVVDRELALWPKSSSCSHRGAAARTGRPQFTGASCQGTNSKQPWRRYGFAGLAAAGNRDEPVLRPAIP